MLNKQNENYNGTDEPSEADAPLDETTVALADFSGLSTFLSFSLSVFLSTLSLTDLAAVTSLGVCGTEAAVGGADAPGNTATGGTAVRVGAVVIDAE